MGLGIAIKAFSAALLNKEKADLIDRALAGKPADSIDASVPAIEAPRDSTRESTPTPPPKPARDSAVALMAALQREARLVDLIQEDFQPYSDAQVGAAARPCLQQCKSVLSRLLQITPLVQADEGASIPIAADVSPLQFQWVGEGTSSSGKLIHHGWQASQVELPTWSGDAADANVIAPAQVEAV